MGRVVQFAVADPAPFSDEALLVQELADEQQQQQQQAEIQQPDEQQQILAEANTHPAELMSREQAGKAANHCSHEQEDA